ncbi:MAG: hemolysin III family protein [Bacillota bacterium]
MRLREPVNGLTHAAGALLSVAALVVLVRAAEAQGTVWHTVGFALFGVSLILLYSASALYHLLPLSARGTAALRRVDHAMIYVLIAGTYSPICLVPLRGPWGWALFALVWGLAVAGILLKVFWFGTPRWLTVLFYLGMGWIVVLVLPLLLRAVPPGALAWIGLGGVFYTSGAIVYALKRPNLLPNHFGFHELFHVLVMAGSFSHFWVMWGYIASMR